MTITTFEDQINNEVVIKLGKKFDYSTIREFTNTYSHFTPPRNFLVDLSNVEKYDSSSLGMLYLLQGSRWC